MKLSKQRTSLDVRKYSFSQRVVHEWNKLSQDVVEATSVNQFKNSRLASSGKGMGIKSLA